MMSRIREHLYDFSFVALSVLMVSSSLSGCAGEEDGLLTGPTMRTEISPNQVVAGSSVSVQCVQVESSGVTTQANDVLVFVDPAEGIELTGQQLVAKTAGVFTVRCAVPEGLNMTSVPATLTVIPGATVSTRLTLDPPSVSAGVYADAICVAVDEFGNISLNDRSHFELKEFANEAGEAVDTGLHFADKAVYGTRAGAYPIACDLLTSKEEAMEPATLTVVAGNPKELRIELDPAKGAYELEETVIATATAYDAHGNIVEDANISPLGFVPAGEGLSIADNSIETREEGTYKLNAHLVDMPEIKGEVEVLVDGMGPQVVLTSPEQAARLNGDAVLMVEGTVSDTMTLITYFAINGTEVSLSETGAFQFQVDLVAGINSVVIDATDANGRNTRVVRWVVWSPDYMEIAADFSAEQNIASGMQFRLGPNSVDDGVHDLTKPDDLATLFEIAMADFSIEEMFGGLSWPLLQGDVGSVSLALQTAQQDPPSVSLLLQEDHLAMQVTLERVQMAGVVATQLFVGPVAVNVDLGFSTIDIDEAVLTARIEPSVDPETSQVVFEVLDTATSFTNLKIEGEGDLSDVFTGLESLVNSEVKPILEQYLASEIKDELAGALQGLMNAWTISTTMNVPGIFGGEGMEMLVEGKLMSIDISEQAMVFNSDIMIQDTDLRVTDLFGSFIEGACGGNDDPVVTDLQMGLKDSLVNRAIHLLWSNSLLDAAMEISDGTPNDSVCGFG